jgi:predicted SAM-dependent methyltransferase
VRSLRPLTNSKSVIPVSFDQLHLGCGLTVPAGWVNVDGSSQVVLARYPFLKRLLVKARLYPASQAAIPWSPKVMRLDLRRPLPFPNETFAAIYSSHTVEHLYYADVHKLLCECYRVMKPGGACRVVVPDLNAAVQRYCRAKTVGDRLAGDRLMEELLVHDKEPRRGVLGWYYRFTAYHQHKWMYDSDSICEMLKNAGFIDVKPMDCFESLIARIEEVENPGRIVDGQGIAVEGRRSS